MINILNYIVWEVDPNIINEPLTIRWYGLLFALGFVLGYQVLKKIFIKEDIPEKWLDSAFIYVFFGTLIGARLGHVFFYDWAYYSENLAEIPKIWKGGLASHGAAIGIIIALWIYSKKVTKKSVLWILDRVVITIALAAVFIRVGNLMNHEIIGEPADLPWAFIFTLVDDQPRHPAQLYEAFCYLITFGTLMFLYWKTGSSRRNGILFGTFLAMIFSARFFIEFVKESQVAFEESMTLNMGQWLSIPLVLGGLFFIVRGLVKKQG